MAVPISKTCSLSQLRSPVSRTRFSYHFIRSQSTASSQWDLKSTKAANTAAPSASIVTPTTELLSPLARLPTTSILRSLFLNFFFTSPILFKPGLAVFQAIAHSKSRWLNPDRNPVLRAGIRPLVYDQFCAGRDAAEINKTSQVIKGLGFSGVVLCYGKEVQLDGDKAYGYMGQNAAMDAEIDIWRDGNLETLDMIGKGDWLGIKCTGAGLQITNTLLKGDKAPPKFTEAMDAICTRARAQGCRIWIDAEQQALQPTIDRWTFDLMRRYNKGEHPLVYSTIQAYLKSAREKVQHQLQLAADEGWRSAIKLVRGAYISNDIRERIHDTKAETDQSYNGIAEDLLRGQNFPILRSNPDLKHDLLLAGHNTNTVRGAARLATELAASSKLKVVPDFAQLQGMADDIGCELLQVGEENARKSDTTATTPFVPKVYKCLTWGTIQECMQYLTRRLVENRGAADRMAEGAALLRSELWRRLTRS